MKTSPAIRRSLIGLCVLAVAGAAFVVSGAAGPMFWKMQWPKTDISRTSVDLGEIRSGGPGKDEIPAIVFDRRVGKRVLDFGTTGNLRKSDMVMYDRQTESWWQQFLGEAIIGELMGARLKMVPDRVESFARFAARAPSGKVLVPTGDVRRAYGSNPYVGYDSSSRPFLYRGDLPKGIAPLAYVLAVGQEAWSLDLVRRSKRIENGDLVITWQPGQASALDQEEIHAGRDIGDVVVQRKPPKGLIDEVHDLTFAFVFHASAKGGTLHK
jgi:hypothetical protein